MIVTMKKLDLLLYHKEKESFLEQLRELGVVHITEHQEVADSHLVQELTGVVHLTERVISALKKIQKEKELTLKAKDMGDPCELIRRFEQFESQKDKLLQDIAVLKKDRDLLEPWGNFDPLQVKKLQDTGVSLRLFIMPAKKFDTRDWSNTSLQIISRQEPSVYFVVVERGEKAEFSDAEEVRLPESSLDALDKKIAGLKEELNTAEKSMVKMVNCISQLYRFHAEKTNLLRYEKARLSLTSQAQGKLLSLSGWFPQSIEKDLSIFLNKFSAWYELRDPRKGDDVPVQLQNRSFPSLFEPIAGLYSLPSYNEIDVVPFMAPFFAIFFGLCLGDVGYGLIITLGALFAGFKVSAKFKPVTKLGFYLGLTTTISGLLLNTFFGQAIFGGPGIEGFTIFPTGANYFATLSPQAIDGEQIFPAMNLALLLGAIQMLVGIAIQSKIRAKNMGFAGAIQPLCTMLMIFGGFVWFAHIDLLELGIGQFTVGPLQVGALLLAVPEIVGVAILSIGLVGFFLFNNIHKKMVIRPLTGIWDFYNFVTGILQTLLSYLRLFALGLASGLLGGAFNQIAFMFVTTDNGINLLSFGMIGTVLVLILGHSLNLALSAISAFVHPLRLTFVEFYSAIGFEGGSKPYVPFAKIKQ